MWGGLLTFIAALFHIGLLAAGGKYIYLAGVPDGLSGLFSFGEQFWIFAIAALLFFLTYLVLRWHRAWPDLQARRVWILLIAAVLLIWGITGAPLNHLNDVSHDYSIFHVAAAFYITLTGICFALAGWSLRKV